MKPAPASCLYEAGAVSSQSSESGESFDPGPQGVKDARADGFAAATATEAAGRREDRGQACLFVRDVALAQRVVREVPRALAEAFGLDDCVEFAVALGGDEGLELCGDVPVEGHSAVELFDEVALAAQGG